MSSACRQLPTLPTLRTKAPCDIRFEGRKRSGRPLYQCRTHGEEATGTDGVPLDRCRGAGAPPVDGLDILDLDLRLYPGGVGIWGACRPVIQIGTVPAEAGVHVHARRRAHGPKVIDASFVIVRVTNENGKLEIDAESAKAHLVSRVLGFSLEALACTNCGFTHLDRDNFAARLHRRHLCNRCGHAFWARTPGISNPVAAVDDLIGRDAPGQSPAREPLALRRDQLGALAIWASNPAIVWTAERPEQSGIHVHAWTLDGMLLHDETFGSVTIDTISIDDEQLRLLMVQRQLGITDGRVASLACPACDRPHLDRGLAAVQPTNSKSCTTCGTTFITPRRKNVVSNPLLDVLAELGLDEDPPSGVHH